VNQFNIYELQQIINPLLDTLIKQQEHTFFIWTLDNSSFIETEEKIMEITTETNNYRDFISRVISEYVDFSKIHGPKERYIDELLLALDICRSVMQSNREGMTVSEVEICEEIDCIL
jgi:hypothetical protein